MYCARSTGCDCAGGFKGSNSAEKVLKESFVHSTVSSLVSFVLRGVELIRMCIGLQRSLRRITSDCRSRMGELAIITPKNTAIQTPSVWPNYVRLRLFPDEIELTTSFLFFLTNASKRSVPTANSSIGIALLHHSGISSSRFPLIPGYRFSKLASVSSITPLKLCNVGLFSVTTSRQTSISFSSRWEYVEVAALPSAQGKGSCIQPDTE